MSDSKITTNLLGRKARLIAEMRTAPRVDWADRAKRGVRASVVAVRPNPKETVSGTDLLLTVEWEDTGTLDDIPGGWLRFLSGNEV